MASELRDLARPTQPIYTIGNPVSITRLQEQAQQQLTRAPQPLPGDPALLAVGRLAWQKGFDLLIEAFADYRAVAPKAQLTIIGEGPDRETLSTQASQYGLHTAVHLPGESAAPLAAMLSADIIISSSRYEGFSNVLLEAMGLGKLVVATNVAGATRQLVIDGKTGILADSSSGPDLARALRRSEQADTAQLSLSAQHHVATNFDLDLVVAQYERAITETFERHD
jgi:glycosyltransferase involved in cell wall biosynthesis